MAWSHDEDDSARLKRLALVISAQFPGDPEKARLVLQHVNALVHAYAGDAPCSHCVGAAEVRWFSLEVARRSAANS